MNPSIPRHLFKAYDIRGNTEDALTPTFVHQLGHALARMAKQRQQYCLCLGYDGRLSSPALATALQDALLANGLDVLNIGLCTSPMLYFATHHSQTHAGIMITGSHNPPKDNGLKIILSGEALSSEDIQALYKLTCEVVSPPQVASGQLQTYTMRDAYIAHIRHDIQLQRPLRVALDCGNAAAGVIARDVFEALGCEVDVLFETVDGQFPHHHPDPSDPNNLMDLMTFVKTNGHDIGLAFDGDADRLGVVNAQGRIIEADHVLMKFAQAVLKTHAQSTIVYDVKCTRHLQPMIQAMGGQALLWKTGHSLMKAKIKETQAALGGELTGHFFFNDARLDANQSMTPRWFGFDDGVYAGARLVELLSHADRHAFWDVLPHTLTTPELHLKLAEGEPHRLMSVMLTHPYFEHATAIHTIDGIRVEFDDGFGLIRASNTTPVLVFRFEADNAQALARIQRAFADYLRQYLPNTPLPF